jgi:hypothetical protein
MAAGLIRPLWRVTIKIMPKKAYHAKDSIPNRHSASTTILIFLA